MKTLKTRLIRGAAVLFFISPLLADDIKLRSGDLGFLKGETIVNVEYVYAGLTVGKITEQAYTQEKVAGYNKQQPGKGEQWLQAWKSNRAARYEPKFEELINKQFSGKKSGLTVGHNPGAKYTLVLRTTNWEPGWNAAVMRRPALVSSRAEFFETKNRSRELAAIDLLEMPGRDVSGYDFDIGVRLQEGYAKTGKELGAFLYKKALR